MCTTCGCSEHSHTHTHTDENGNTVIHTHEHEPTTKTVTVEEDILARNNHVAKHNREHLRDKHILALNFVSSPGSGKTELLCATVRAMGENAGVYVIEGDQETSNDADRIRATGAPAVQINTGKGCHLDAEMVHEAIHALAPADNSVLFIENVGNLVCPAAFDLGEAHKVVILSVTEGEDKPLKYPEMFRASDLMIINKIDLAPYVNFDLDRCEEYARRVNPKIAILRVSATKGDGMDKWVQWIKAQRLIAALG